ncbi:hypothetical protein CPB85DRAFT_389537 [Mucidula mucida]|nr:hypothetical protein CPB85DRAFT_389537 [Mucidula mucida]
MVKKRKQQKPESPAPSEGLDIPEDEQWRLIQESGVLNQIPLEKPPGGSTAFHPPPADVQDEDSSLSDEIFNAILYIIPFSFCLLMMEILIHHQYGKQPGLKVLVDRMVSGVPIMSIFIFYTMRYKNHRRMQFFLFVASCFAGSRMLYMLARVGFIKNMKQCPPLATLWIYTIVQLDLGPAVLNLIFVGAYVWWKDLKLLR